MAGSVNKVIIVGNLGSQPEFRSTASGRAMANVNIATNREWTDKESGERHKQTEWHRVVFFRRLAEIVNQYLSKGSQVYIEGYLQTRKWQDNNGQDRYTTEIVAYEMQMLGSKEGGQTASFDPAPAAGAGAPPPGAPAGEDLVDDDIPF